MITIDLTLVIHVINMIVLMYVLNIVLYKPVQEILRKREETLGSMGKDVEQFEANARHRQAEVDKKMLEASSRAKKALDGARAEAQAAGGEKLAAIRMESDEAKEKQLSEIRSQVDSARKELQDTVSVFASQMAGKILGRSLEA